MHRPSSRFKHVLGLTFILLTAASGTLVAQAPAAGQSPLTLAHVIEIAKAGYPAIKAAQAQQQAAQGAIGAG